MNIETTYWTNIYFIDLAVRLYTITGMVILDLTIPGGMDCKETLAELLKIDPDIIAIASSGYSNDPVMTLCH